LTSRQAAFSLMPKTAKVQPYVRMRVSIAWVSAVRGSGLTESDPPEPDAENGS
jgi:hypothetical protein